MPPLIHVTPGDPNPRLSTIYNPRFGHVRVLQQQFGAKSAPILIEGQEINQIFDAENSMNRLFIFGLPILAVVLGILIWFVVGQAMKPVEKARLAVAEISANDLDEEVPSPKSGDELDRLVSTMNAMLRRLQAALRRERRFIADASHELRSPIAAIRSALESHDQDMAGLRQSHENALSAVQRLDTTSGWTQWETTTRGRGAGMYPSLPSPDEWNNNGTTSAPRLPIPHVGFPGR
jgi:signal transduction histidine kinase